VFKGKIEDVVLSSKLTETSLSLNREYELVDVDNERTGTSSTFYTLKRTRNEFHALVTAKTKSRSEAPGEAYPKT
jgi:HKD family nuclease